MKLQCIMFLCLLLTVLNLSYLSITRDPSSIPTTMLTQRRILREQLQTGHEQEVVDKGRKQFNDERAFMNQDNETSEDGEELVYHVDYHGVSTHPTPTPKHPRP
ncbi:hypothetical protein Scep_023309 [Stephania cephalantha]|uniref:Uncharacterized protein n=1 Tax=Stephania cephalantha TaxID=152367 RepID=A0AAP0F3F6_9MAGN